VRSKIYVSIFAKTIYNLKQKEYHLIQFLRPLIMMVTNYQLNKVFMSNMIPPATVYVPPSDAMF
jgi:hypothetical protein